MQLRLVFVIITQLVWYITLPAQSEKFTSLNGPIFYQEVPDLYPGVLRSTDREQTWSQFGSTGRTSPGYSVASDSAGNIYMGISTALFLSTNEGTSWSQAGLRGLSIQSILVCRNGQLFTAFSAGDVIRIQTSIDSGIHWRELNPVTAITATFTSMIEDPSGILLASGMGATVFRSSDRGLSWDEISLGEGESGGNFAWPLAVSGQGTMFTSSGIRGFRSTTHGATWQPILDRPLVAMAATPNGTVVAATYNQISLSTDDGLTWVPSFGPSYFGAAAADARNSVYVGTGDTRYTDRRDTLPMMIFWHGTNDTNWNHSLPGPNVSGVWRIAADTIGHIFANTRDGNLYCYTTFDSEWTNIDSYPSSGLGTSISVGDLHMDEGGTLYVAGPHFGVLRGRSSTYTFSPNTRSVSFGRIHTGTVSVDTIQVVNNGTSTLTINSFHCSDAQFTAMARPSIINPGASGNIIITFRPTLAASVSTTISVLSNAFTSPDIIRISAVGQSKHHLRIDHSGVDFQYYGPGSPDHKKLTILSDGYDSLRIDSVTSTNPLFSVSTNKMELGAGDSLQLLLGLHAGAFGDHAGSIHLFSNSPSSPDTIPITATIFRVGSLEAGLNIPPPTYFHLERNFPNPFNSTTVFIFGIPVEARVTLNIYNILGQEVARPFDGSLSPLYYAFIWSPQELPSGVYFVRFVANSYSQTEKILYTR